MRLHARIAALALVVALPVVHAQPASTAVLSARLDSAMRTAEARGFSGVVLVEQDGAVLLERGYGLANRAAGTPFGAGTVVQIGSNTKDFTIVAILRLQAAGRLSLSDSIGRFFGAVPADKRGITLAHLMNHRAGFPQGIGGDFEPVDRTALIDSAMRTRLLFPPGARASYSNTGFSLLAAIIEQLTGTGYDAHVAETILRPLGLRRTGFLLPGFAAGDLAHGYLASGRDMGTMLDRPHAADGPYWNLRGNGGMLSTVGDMHRFYQALFTGEAVLTQAARGRWFDPAEPTALAGSDGVSFFLYERFPRLRTTLLIASTNAAVRAPEIRRALGPHLGLPAAEGGDGPVARRTGGVVPSPAVAAVLTAFTTALNAADAVTLRQFIVRQFASGDGAPTVEERMARLSTMRERLGALTVEDMQAFSDGSAEVRVRTVHEGPATIGVQLEREAPYRIRSVQVRVGG